MWRRLRESSIPRWEELWDDELSPVKRQPSPVSVMYSRSFPQGITVLSGSQFFYFNEDTTVGYYLRSEWGNNIACILNHFVSHDVTTDLTLTSTPSNPVVLAISGNNGNNTPWAIALTCNAFYWERFINQVKKMQRHIRKIFLYRALYTGERQHRLTIYKMISAFKTSEFSRLFMPLEISDLIIKQLLSSQRDLKKHPPVARIETKSFEEIRSVKSELLVSQHVNRELNT